VYNNIDEIRGGNTSVFLFSFAGSFCCAGIEFQQPTRPSTKNIREHLLAALKRVRTSLLRSNE
jgi:hypothetical protein